MSNKREQNRRSISQRILAAARELILEKESTDFTMPELAATAGVALVTPYKHFESKAGVLNALLGQITNESDPEDRAASDSPFAPLDRILAFGDTHVSRLVGSENLSRPILSGLVKLNSETPYVVGDQWVSQWRTLLQDAFDQGLLHGFVDPRLTARSLHLAFVGAATKWQNHEVSSKLFAADVRYCTAIILLGIASSLGEPMLRHRFAEAESALSAALENSNDGAVSDSAESQEALANGTPRSSRNDAALRRKEKSVEELVAEPGEGANRE